MKFKMSIMAETEVRKVQDIECTRMKPNTLKKALIRENNMCT